MRDLSKQLNEIRQSGLYRSRRIGDSPQGPEVVIDQHKVLNFCSNDYLGLANHAEVNKAYIKGIERWGSGSGAAHLINGHSAAHHALEEELAEFTGRPRALLFSTGYMANLGIATALLRRGDGVFEDRLNHASLLDAGLSSAARFYRYRHADAGDLAAKLTARDHAEKLVMTDGVFSMDGDIAPLPKLAEACAKHNAWLMVDDAHGFGVLGENGGGSLALHNLGTAQVPIVMGTLGKAFGTFGAFVAGSEELIETLIQKARTYIYTTALPSAVAVATSASLKLAREETWRRERLQHLIKQFNIFASELGLQCMPSDTPIQPILTGDSEKASAMSRQLFEAGILVTAIRPPTVPQNTARLRITFSAAHTDAHLETLMNALESVFTKHD